ncbi:hypothetical protein [Streptomyces sp. NPDC059883]|uniref:hypothetical protein n=1 Tax=unclassified Streptomyces TaxID=2593676 RepID=UPI00365CD32E
MSLRRLRVLVEHLPPDSATGRAVLGHHWSHETYMLADLLDLNARLHVDFRNANRGEKSPEEPYPEPAWRPGDRTPKQKAKAARKALAEARQGYRRIVAIATPEHMEKG